MPKKQSIKDTAKFYKNHKYVVIRNFISKEQAAFIYNYGMIRAQRASTMINSKWPDYREDVDGTYTDQQVPGTYSCYADPVMETLLLQGLQGMREITGLNLAPTYSYWRLYKQGDVLKRHKDRPSCEISTTLCLGYDTSNMNDSEYDWPMWVKNDEGVEYKIHLTPGDMIIYRGCEIEHWREPYAGINHAQVFMHYNDANGPYNIKYDGRPMLGLPGKYRNYKEDIDENYVKIIE